MSDIYSSLVYTSRNERKDEMKKNRAGALCLMASFALGVSALMTGCTTQQMADSPGSDKLAFGAIRGIVGRALKDASASCSVDWCWAVVQDVQTGYVLFADGMVHDVNMRMFGAPWNASVLSVEEMRSRIAGAEADGVKAAVDRAKQGLSDPADADESEVTRYGMRMDLSEHLYPVYGMEPEYTTFKGSYVAVASGFAPELPFPEFYVAVCIADPMKAGEDVAKKAARTAVLNICTGIGKVL